jgi:hypothetical protein
LYLTDSEAFLQAIHKWIGCGAKLNLRKSPDTDILMDIILKLQKRVEAGAATLLINLIKSRSRPTGGTPYMKKARLSGMSGLASNPANRQIA